LKELQIFLNRHPHQHGVRYWRTSNDIEVDFVLSLKNKIFPFEVTYQSQADRSKVRHLKIFLAQEPKASYGFYVYNGPLQIDEVNKICFLPAWIIS
jgi:predicted AAA+ superfamily ATPase